MQEMWDIRDRDGRLTGHTMQRGPTLPDGAYHLVVHVWIQDETRRWLIQKRAEHLESWAGHWDVTGGSVLAGEDSLTAAIRETQEELGIELPSSDLTLVHRQIRTNSVVDVWLVRIDSRSVQLDCYGPEVTEVMFATDRQIATMIAADDFYDYGPDYFAALAIRASDRS